MSSKMIKYLAESAIPNLHNRAKTLEEIRQYLIDCDFEPDIVDAAIVQFRQDNIGPCDKWDLGTHCIVIPDRALDIARHESNEYEQARVLRSTCHDLGFHITLQDAMQMARGEYL